MKTRSLAPFLMLAMLLPLSGVHAATSTVNLAVPHIWEIPDGVWVPPWSGACEEASVVMAEQFYLGHKETRLTRTETKSLLSPLFTWETKTFGTNLDTDAAQTLRMINEYSSMNGVLKKDPTLDDIKAELRAGHPVISFHYGRGLKNPRHRFRAGGSSYHVMVITGYDDTKREFLVNDSELPDALDFRYSYDTILNTLHDFDWSDKKADGPAVVIFTRPKQIVKVAGKSALYLIEGGKKRYISSPTVFKNHRWSWSLVKSISQDEMDNYPSGEVISK